MPQHFLPFKPLRQLVVLVTATTLMAGVATAYTLWKFRSSQPSDTPAATSPPKIETVTALGRLEPSGEVTRLSAPNSVEGNRVKQLLVKEGDKVKVGQVIAVLDNRDRLQYALEEAKGQASTAQARLAQVRAGVKAGEINAQKAAISRLGAERQGDIAVQKAAIARLGAEQQGEITAQKAAIGRLKAELRNAQTEYQRYQALYRSGAISASSRDSKRLSATTMLQQLSEAQANLYRITASRQEQLNEAKANLYRITASRQEQLNEAEATLDRIAEVRLVDVNVTQAEVDRTIAAVKQAQANLDLATVQSPRDSQVLRIHTWPGEVVSNEGIVDLGQTDQMDVVAEVYESDVGKVRIGQQVRVTCNAVPGELQGTVEHVGLQVQRQNVINTDPTADIDARIVEARVQLNQVSSQQVAGFTNLQVKVEILL